MDEYNFFMELAKIMNIKTYPKVSKKEYLKKIIEPLTHSNKDITLDYLKDNCFNLHKDVAWEDLSFKTPSKKYELFSSLAKDEHVKTFSRGSEPYRYVIIAPAKAKY